MNEQVSAYHASLSADDKMICDALYDIIHSALPEAENKVWHAHPVWFLDGNPIVGYSKLKHCVRLLFWSGQSFDEPGLIAEGSFKAAEKRFTTIHDIDKAELIRCLEKARHIQWDYKNLIKRKGVLEKL